MHFVSVLARTQYCTQCVGNDTSMRLAKENSACIGMDMPGNYCKVLADSAYSIHVRQPSLRTNFAWRSSQSHRGRTNCIGCLPVFSMAEQMFWITFNCLAKRLPGSPHRAQSIKTFWHKPPSKSKSSSPYCNNSSQKLRLLAAAGTSRERNQIPSVQLDS